jgi:hypothetical protein
VNANPIRGMSGLAASILQAAADALAPFVKPVVNYFPTGTLVLNTQTVLRATIAGPQQIQWPCDGYLVAIQATPRVVTNDLLVAANTQMQLRVVVDGNLELFTTGTAPGYRPFYALTGPVGSWCTRVTFSQGVPWQVYIQNVASGVDVTCDVSFDYVNTTSPRPANQ